MGHSLLAWQRYIAGEWSNSKSPRKVVDWFDLFFRTKWVRLPSSPLNLTTIWAAFPFSIAKFRKMNRQSSLPTFLEVMYLIHIFPFFIVPSTTIQPIFNFMRLFLHSNAAPGVILTVSFSLNRVTLEFIGKIIFAARHCDQRAFLFDGKWPWGSERLNRELEINGSR